MFGFFQRLISDALQDNEAVKNFDISLNKACRRFYPLRIALSN